MWRPEARAWSLSAEQLHGRNGVIEEVAEAEHGTDQNTRESTTILKKKKNLTLRGISSHSQTLSKKKQVAEIYLCFTVKLLCANFCFDLQGDKNIIVIRSREDSV